MFKWLRALGRRGKTPQDAAAADERPRKHPKKRDASGALLQTAASKKRLKRSQFTKSVDTSLRSAAKRLMEHTVCNDDVRKMKLIASYLHQNAIVLLPESVVPLAGWEFVAAIQQDVGAGEFVEKRKRLLEQLTTSENDEISSAAKFVLRRTLFGDDAKLARRIKIAAAALPPGQSLDRNTILQLEGWNSPADPVQEVQVGRWWTSTQKTWDADDDDDDDDDDKI